jgi:uncharacterized protein (TIGR03067 family)
MRVTPLVPALVLALFAVGRVGADDAGQKAVKEELKALSGTWEAEIVVRDGKEVPRPPGGLTMVIDDARWALKFGGREVVSGLITVDPTRAPRTIDIRITEEDGKGDLLKGVYELKGDTLRMALAEQSKERAAGFSARGATVFTYKRVKR